MDILTKRSMNILTKKSIDILTKNINKTKNYSKFIRMGEIISKIIK